MDLNWQLIISILSLLGVGTIFAQFWKDRIEKRKQNSKEQKERKRKERIEETEKIFEELNRPMRQQLDRIEGKQDQVVAATVLSLRSDMKQTLEDCRHKGYAAVGDKAHFDELYNKYSELGGNHFKEYVAEWKNEMDDFPKNK